MFAWKQHIIISHFKKSHNIACLMKSWRRFFNTCVNSMTPQHFIQWVCSLIHCPCPADNTAVTGIRHKLSIKAQSSSLSPLTQGPRWPPHTPPSARHWRRGFDPCAHRQSRSFWRERLGMLKHDFHLPKFRFSFCQHVLHLFSRQPCPGSTAARVDWVYLTLWYYAFDAVFFFFEVSSWVQKERVDGNVAVGSCCKSFWWGSPDFYTWLTGPNCNKSTSLKSDIKGHYAVITTVRPVKSAFKLKLLIKKKKYSHRR